MPSLSVHGEMTVVEVYPADNFVRLRAVANSRIRDGAGGWKDGEPCYMDVYVNGKAAEHVPSSVMKGDRIVISGVLEQKPWTTDDGQKRDGYRIYANEIGTSLTFTDAPTDKMRGLNGNESLPDPMSQSFDNPF
jgi:single-stranded DNA-binding protein